jgi:hypothetical protein
MSSPIIIKEGKKFKGGINQTPTSPRPNVTPPAGKPKKVKK